MSMFKRQPYRNQKIRDSANGESCDVGLPGCLGSGTVVWAHSNYYEDGKGAGQKADDIFGCYACHHCHGVLDGQIKSPTWDLLSDDEKRDLFHRAMKRSIRKLLDKGIIK